MGFTLKCIHTLPITWLCQLITMSECFMHRRTQAGREIPGGLGKAGGHGTGRAIRFGVPERAQTSSVCRGGKKTSGQRGKCKRKQGAEWEQAPGRGGSAKMDIARPIRALGVGPRFRPSGSSCLSAPRWARARNTPLTLSTGRPGSRDVVS